MKYPQPRAAYIDVDRTLLEHGRVNMALVKWCRAKHEAGWRIYVWSSRGAAYCQKAVARLGMEDCVAACLDKPAIIVDDQGIKWIRRYVSVCKPPPFGLHDSRRNL